MSLDKIKELLPGTKIQDTRTGEVLFYDKYVDPYVLSFDERGLTIWLTLDRIEVKK